MIVLESAVATHERRDGLDIRQDQRRIRRGFEEDHVKGAVGPEHLFRVREVARVHTDGRDAEALRAQVFEEEIRPAVHRIAVENAPPLGHEGQDRRRDGAHARGKRRRVRGTSFERHHLVFEDLRVGVVQPRVDQPGLLPVIAGEVVRALEERRALRWHC